MGTRTADILRRRKMDITAEEMIELFVATKQSENRSPKTISWYRDMLKRFVAYVSNGHQAKLADISVAEARAFVAHLQSLTGDQQLSPHTIHGYVRAMKAFSSWLFAEGIVKRDLFARLNRPKLPETLVETLTDEEITRIFGAINPNTFLGARLKAIFLLLLDTGLRASELCHLKLDDVDLQAGTIKVLGKGRKERLLPFSPATKKALLIYIHTFRPEPENENVGELILTTDGGRLSYDGLRHIMQRFGKRVDIPRLHAHLFRHTFAVRYLMNGGDVMSLRLLLGHTSLEVTKMYIHLAESHIQIQHHKFSPVARLGIR